MKQKLSRFLVVIFILTAVFICIAEAVANPHYEGRMAVVLVIDASGSMAWNDPDRVRVVAAQKTLDFLKNDDYLALVEFNSTPRVIMRTRPVGDEESRREIRLLMDRVGQRGNTDILGGLRTAYHQLTEAPPDARKFVILLSDGESDVPGVTDTPRGRQRYFAETEELLARYAQQGWPVHCIGLCAQEAGSELANIAAKTSGEYQFVTQADELRSIFANILLAAKYPPGVQPVFHAVLEERENYLVGDVVSVQAYITIGDDRVLPGPYLELTGMNLVVSRPDAEPEIVPFVESAEDGVFQADVSLEAPAEYELMVTATASYRGHEITETIILGSVAVAEGIQAPLVSVAPERVKETLELLGYGAAAVAYLLLLVVTILLWRLRLRERVGGELCAWVGTRSHGHKHCKYRLRLAKARKREVKIVAGNAGNKGDGDFQLEPIEDRSFGFLIRSIRDPLQDLKLRRVQRLFPGPRILYEVVCLPGTAMQVGEKLKSRKILSDGDMFEIGGYSFEFRCPYIGKHPGGKEVLDSYRALIDEPKPKAGFNPEGVETTQNTCENTKGNGV
jgi:hypothetical protein